MSIDVQKPFLGLELLDRITGRKPSDSPKTRHAHRRRLLSGITAAAGDTGLTWVDLVEPGPAPTGGAAHDQHHPSRKHDVPQAAAVYLLEQFLPSTRAKRREQRRTATRRTARSQRATTRSALLEQRLTPLPSRAVLRWAARTAADDPAVEHVLNAHNAQLP